MCSSSRLLWESVRSIFLMEMLLQIFLMSLIAELLSRMVWRLLLLSSLLPRYFHTVLSISRRTGLFRLELSTKIRILEIQLLQQEIIHRDRPLQSSKNIYAFELCQIIDWVIFKNQLYIKSAFQNTRIKCSIFLYTRSICSS